MIDFVLVRAIFAVLLAFAAAFFHPLEAPAWANALLGLGLAGAAVAAETRVAKASLQRLIGSTVGTIAGLIAAALVTVVLGTGVAAAACMMILVYLGATVGASKGDLLNLAAFGGVFGVETDIRHSHKILDTSVIIDGRIADIADTGFLDGVLVIPQFVLHELQMVADSADSMKRNRGRRGLDILQRIQKMGHLTVQIVQDDFPKVPEVDMKLIELAKVYGCKIVTNDFNLNKVAQVRGVEVLNINELANSLKPIVLPGELMRVFILKEGKEYNQGVAYLDDGTMVVVDNARRMISKTIDVSVTSVLQTTAGKMIFGKFDERSQSGPAPERPVQQQQAPPVERTDRAPRREHAAGEGHSA